MTQPTELAETVLDTATAAGTASKPEFRYVPVRRTQLKPTSTGAYALPEVDDEVLTRFSN
ncbi:MAG: hypothetical protein AAGM33_11855 [Pseudomonadota bacterium]